MSWDAPDLSALAEQSMARARIALSSDPRVADAARGGLSEPLTFVAELIEERLRASYITGLEAAEASYRAGASEFLRERGASIDSMREQVRESGERLLAHVPPYPLSLPRTSWPASRLAGLTMTIWLVVIALLYFLASWWTPGYTVLALLAGGLDAMATYAWRSRGEARAHRAIVDELPVSVCRHYLDDYRKRVAKYVGEIESTAP